MKKMIYVMMALLIVSMASMASATTSLDFKVSCDEGRWNSNICRDYELQDEFNTVTDFINSLDTRMSTQEAREDRVGGGTSFRRVQTYMHNDFMSELNTTFVKKTDYDLVVNELKDMQKYVYFMNLGYKDIYVKGMTWYGYDANGDLDCLRMYA